MEKTETETENCAVSEMNGKFYLKLLNETKDKISTRGRERKSERDREGKAILEQMFELNFNQLINVK